ncbi:unnamed protein product [Fraxinus pennsylvanica]|uniref:Uncharacterized protein n=1 Tax=Fraxinus pennsylvanica TaxID=56036 RepID=A0AAD1ZMX6_9LAMI|nr:unnamed protein product [Fraxinus pennsylvanica]
MGNCLANPTLIAEDGKPEPSKKAKTTSRVVSITNLSKLNARNEGISTLENFSEFKGKTVRIRVLLTQRELSQLLNGELQKSSSSSSSHQLLNALQLKGRRIAEAGLQDWRPDLETIPEDY